MYQAVNLKEARDFSNDKKFIYVFKVISPFTISFQTVVHLYCF